jgi:hypothetical protein
LGYIWLSTTLPGDPAWYVDYRGQCQVRGAMCGPAIQLDWSDELGVAHHVNAQNLIGARHIELDDVAWQRREAR